MRPLITFFFLTLSSFGLFSCSKKRDIKVLHVDGPKTPVSKPEIRPLPDIPKKLGPWHKRRPRLSKQILKYCDKIQYKFKKYGWGKSYCKSVDWVHVRDSFLGEPLVWSVYGEEERHTRDRPVNMTLILCGVHADEITPIKFCFDIINFLEKRPELYKDQLVAVAPVVTPDSFFMARPRRTNYRGVDVNRNFPTADWSKDALRLWKKRYRRDKRRYPGKKAASEAETIFQMNLVKRYRPTKIISVHAPLTLIDYDGPAVQSAGKKDLGKLLLKRMGKLAKGYKIKDYPVFPGSLGNWAGLERKIPTYTLELPSSDNRKSRSYWKLFKGAIEQAIIDDFGLLDRKLAKRSEKNAVEP